MSSLSKILPLVFPPAPFDNGSKTGFRINSNFVFETSGDFVALRFNAQKSMSSESLSVSFFVTADSGTSGAFNVELRKGAHEAPDDPDRPEAGGATIGTPPANQDLNGTAGTWVTFTLTNVTLSEGSVYFLTIKNVDGSPATNYADICYRGNMDGGVSQAFYNGFVSVYDTDGYATDPNVNGGIAPIILDYGSGLVNGNPYIDTGAAFSGTNYRGNQFEFGQEVRVCGLVWTGTTSSVDNGTVGLYQTDGTVIKEVTLDYYPSVRTTQVFFEPVTIGDFAFNALLKPLASTSVGSSYAIPEGVSAPASVLASSQDFVNGKVTGSDKAALTVTSHEITVIGLMLEGFPVSGGGLSISRSRSVLPI